MNVTQNAEIDACEHRVPLVDYCRTCEQVMPSPPGSAHLSIHVDASQAVAALEAAEAAAEEIGTRVTTAEIARLRAVAVQIAYDYAATIDGEWGCCHDADELRAGGRMPQLDGEEFEPIPDDCQGARKVAELFGRLRGES